MNRQWLQIALGIITATGGFLDAGTIATAGAAGADYGLGLIWAVLVATGAVMLLVDMAGRFSAVSQKTYAAAIRENFGFKFFLIPLISEYVAESLLLAAEIGGIAIALSLFTGIDWRYLFPFAAVLVWIAVWRAPFSFIENGPALLGLVVLSFIAGLVLLGGPGPHLTATLWNPPVKSGHLADYLYLVAAILGSTISPYLIYFYSSGAREEGWTRESLLINRATAIIGMGFGSIGQTALIMLSAIVLLPLNMGANTLGEMGISMAKAVGPAGALLFAVVLFVTCFGAAMEVTLDIGYITAQGFGWEWGENKAPVEAARFNLTLTLILIVAFGIGMIGGDPLQLALLASVVLALVLPFDLFPFIILMNDRDYLGEYVNSRWMNVATAGVLVMAFVVALVSLPLTILSGGG